MKESNGLKSNWSRVWGKQLADKKMCENYRRGWDRIFNKKKNKKSA